VKLDFAVSAPLRLVFSTEVTASPQAVYRALAIDVTGWPSWFTAVARATPTDSGAGREIRLRGGVRFAETIVATEPGERYAYRVDETNVPGVRALLEEWRITATATGTRVRWTFAADAPAPLRAVMRLAGPGMGVSFRGAVRRLDRILARSTAP
jgi:uncharacterized protein YndB with AHSA1/START domain